MTTSRLAPLPAHITILGARFRVVVTDSEGVDDEGSAGDMMGMYRRIRIDGTLDRAKQWRVLAHEYVHACLHMVGLDAALGEELDETVAQTLEHGIEQLLKQVGPQLLAAMTADDDA